MADLRGVRGTRAPLGVQILQFHAVFVKFGQNHMLAPPARGNPLSATVIYCFYEELDTKKRDIIHSKSLNLINNSTPSNEFCQLTVPHVFQGIIKAKLF